MFTTGNYLEKINENFAILKYEIEGASSYGLHNINKHAERFMKTLLNLTLDLQLVNLNDLTANYPGLDLGDDNKKIAFQITSTKTSDKVNDTLTTCIKFKSYETFDSIIIFILGSKQQTYSITIDTSPYFKFDSSRNIYDFDYLQKLIGACDESKIKAIIDFMELELPYLKNRLQLAKRQIFNVPYDRNPYFIGRTEIIKKVWDSFKQRHQIVLNQAISGLGGIGKTQTALEYAYTYRQNYSAIFWVVADTQATLQSGLLDIAGLLDLTQNEKEASIIINRVKIWLDMNEGWLLVLDNADEPSIVKDYLPKTSRGHTLLTSRAIIFDTVGIVDAIELNTLSETDAIDFLVKRTGSSITSQEDETNCKEIARELGYLPLALEQAGAFIKELGVTYEQYLQEFRKDKLAILELKSPVTGNYHSTISRTWSMNFNSISTHNPASTALLHFTAFVSPDNIPVELIKDGFYKLPILDHDFKAQTAVPFAFERNLEPLSKFSLIKRETSSQSYSIHRLVQEAIKISLTKTDQELWAKTICQSLNLLFPDASFITWPLCERLVSHALLSVQYVDQYTFHYDDCGSFLNGLACYLRMRGNFLQSEQIHLKSLFVRERDCGPNSSESTTALNNLSFVYTDQLQYPKALPLFKRALEINEQLYPTDDPELSLANNNLGFIYVRGKQAEKGIPYLKKALQLEKSALEPADFFIALILNNLAEAYLNIGDIETALPLCEEGLQMRERIGNPEKTHRSYATMALILLHKKKYQEAETFINKCITMSESVFGINHPELLKALEIYERLLIVLNRPEDLKKIKERIETIYNKFNLSPVYLEDHH